MWAAAGGAFAFLMREKHLAGMATKATSTRS